MCGQSLGFQAFRTVTSSYPGVSYPNLRVSNAGPHLDPNRSSNPKL